MPKSPFSIFAVPCEQAKDNVFYCQSEFYEGRIHKKYTHMLADTGRLITRLAQDDPVQIEHAARKYKGEEPASWIKKGNSILSPCYTGSFVLDGHVSKRTGSPNLAGLTMATGFAGVLPLAHELKLPFLPICVETAGDGDPFTRQAQLKSLVQDIGYAGTPRLGPGLVPFI